ncbi:MAG: hypothetical protein A2508_01495 [Candidatus Lambdaproteobacteria bacterium RIFOXYD12_FULL_49_8]|uniref:Uncharacterized protein n=1 Tax=Candidatus Lambdaproteobacteria bacterium RIFOXYD2_FULL_50_16 TaxID=1817772 RepID=A0A1F6G541_9PROT|nr:MAG: hypothetical protein A2527_13325 [Candidatus Lambdaproteobacteria bacterium RIFOXYD2_FULL_50_16]OGG97484.1 MAG: hypothetical protein A2508_01495 [Candidatus Lambdaproteobacteria bacterium RIFOXYD12_FULL_49_8]
MKVSTLWLFLAFLALPLLAQPVPNGISPWTQKKMDWLDQNGTAIRRGKPESRETVIACRRKDHILVRRPFGIEMDWNNAQVIECPAFFSSPVPLPE